MFESVLQLGQAAGDLGASAIALLGSLTPRTADPREYAQILKALSEARLPAFYIPGPEDAPFSEFLREAASFEVVYPHVRGIHASFAMHAIHLWRARRGFLFLGNFGDERLRGQHQRCD